MFWQDEGYLLGKNNLDENSIVIDTFTLNHGKFSGVLYGGSSKKQKKFIQVGNKIMLNWKSKGENKNGYFSAELIKPISPQYFDDKKKSICILSALSILKILLPDRQNNKMIYLSFDQMIEKLSENNWIIYYLLWELSLVKDLGYEINYKKQKSNDLVKNITNINGKFFQIPDFLAEKKVENITNNEIKRGLIFNKNLLMENFIIPNQLDFPFSRNILEKYY